MGKFILGRIESQVDTFRIRNGQVDILKIRNGQVDIFKIRERQLLIFLKLGIGNC